MSPSKQAQTAPKTLGKHGKKLWEQTLATYDLVDAHHLRLLEAAAICLDRADAAREVIEAQGITTVNSRNEVKEHPAVGIERQAFSTFRGLIRELGLDIEPAEVRGPRRPGTRS